MRRLAARAVLSIVAQSAVSTVGVASVVSVARADDTGAQAPEPPPGYHRESRDHSALLYAGGGMLLGAWIAGGATVGIGRWVDSDLDNPKVLWMVLPIAGPFVELQYADKAVVQTLLVADGVVQVAGLGLAVLGYALPTSVVVRSGTATAAAAVRLAPVPIAFGRDGVGAGVAGIF